MKRIISSVLAVGVWMTPVTATLMAQPGWGQSQESQVEEALRLLQLAVQQTQKEQPLQAIETFQQVLAIARQIADRELESLVLLGLGRNYDHIGKPQQALDYFNQALPISRKVGARDVVATTLNNIGKVYSDIGKTQQALDYFNQALLISREVGDRSGEAATLNGIGSVYYNIGKLQQALDYLNQALLISREVGDRLQEASTLNSIGVVYSDIGKPQQALDYLNQALPILRKLGPRDGVANTLYGKPQQALDYYNQALPILREVGPRSEEATTLNNIGGVYYQIGKLQQALDYLNQALPILREVGASAQVASTLNNIGLVYSDIGKPQQALDYFNQALPISREVGDRVQVATTLNNIGLVYSNIGKQQQALDFYNQALPISREVGDRSGEVATLNNIGGVYSNIGKQQQALDFYNQALPILREVGAIAQVAATLNNIGGVYSDIGKPQQALDYLNQALPISREVGDRSLEATILSNIGGVYRDTNRPDTAIANLEKSIKITLEMRQGLQRENRKQFLYDNQGYVVALVDILIDQNQPDLAFEWLNLATTFDLADYTRLINAKVRNPEAQGLIDQWNQNYERIQFLYGRLEDNPSNQLSQQINVLWSENNQLAEDISRRFPEVAELFETKPADIAKLQANIPEGTVLIQPVLLTNITNVPNNIAIFVLTANGPTQVTKVKIEPTEFDELLEQYRQQLENPLEDSHEFEDNQKQLYDYLILPVEAQIKAASPKQLAIIATDKLRYIPFETLYDRETDQYLIEKYPISYRTRLSAREKPSEKQPSSPGRVLALGNPVFSGPQHLPGAEEEARKINEIMAGKLLLGFHATLDAFKLQAPQSQLLHLATHGCFQKGGCPQLQMEENTLLFADRKLNISEAALLGLENVDLIALSACQTAMEADSNGEEIAGLAYLFERAGAGAVMASLWNADDESTKEIMVEFYQHLKDGKMSKAEALQKAKLAQIYKYQHHSSWSPFILIGDGS